MWIVQSSIVGLDPNPRAGGKMADTFKGNHFGLQCHGRPVLTCFRECAPVAQLDRAIGFEPIGRGFESLRAHHPLLKLK